MIVNAVLGIIGIISGLAMIISNVAFVYFMVSASKYSSRKEANKFFGSYMLNNPKRYMLAFGFLLIAAISLSVGFIASFIMVFITNPLLIWEIAGTISITSLAVFFILFTSIDNPRQFIDYIKFLRSRH